MDFSTICRTCLKSSNVLKPIFKDGDDFSLYSSVISEATGVTVQYGDDLPQHMCKKCITKLNHTLKFRRKCLDTEIKLKLAINTKQLTFDDFDNDNQQMIDRTILEPESKSRLQQNKEEMLSDPNDILSDIPNISNPGTAFSPVTKRILMNDESDDDSTRWNINMPDTTSSLPEFDNDSDIPYNVNIDPATLKVANVVCKLCHKKLSVRSIDLHIATMHPGADDRKVKCDLCDNYITKARLNRHMIMMHGRTGDKCGYCKAEFPDKDTLRSHIENCTSKKKRRKTYEAGRALVECEVCGKVMQKASLRMHTAMTHGGMKPVCEHCGKSFGNKLRLHEHYRAKHGYDKFTCSHCDFQSANVMAMRNHERRHRGDKPFVCECCGAKFHAAYLLAQHKHTHNTQKIYKCDRCPATFKANNNLHMHKLNCHSKTMYRCVVCNKNYKCRHYALKHLRHVHKYTGNAPPLAVIDEKQNDISLSV